ncbi:uncharacterized protein LOC111676408 [Lucilia cuprina]|uniref:uncharacterized protein LOC111676408 n=1 Tax=Lucilia cuprina TaxID=7375 RepID=UPI001F06276D|nr:uncharacterized protein LOC111676408 [Lucilia cuprina]
MFTPIKNFITYIQKNASGNSIFGGNSTTEEESTKMETENMKTEIKQEDIATTSTMQSSEQEIPKETDKKEIVDDKKCEEEKQIKMEEPKDTSLEATSMSESKKTTTTFMSTSTISAENSCEFEDDDIEAQIESSFMLKKPIKVSATRGSEILEVKKTSNANCSIVISHDYNRGQALSPIDDELNDFRDDPTEILGATSSPCSNQHAEEFCSVGSEDEALERDGAITPDEFVTEEEGDADDNEREKELKFMDGEETDLEIEEDDRDVETENEQRDVINIHDDEEDEEEPFLDLVNFKNSNVIVLDEVDLNTSTNSIDTNNTADDPLAIACEEQEAFAADKTAALEELNLLNTSQTSQDEDTRTTTEDDLQWLKTDLEDNQPSCSNKVALLKDNTSEVTPEKEERNGEGSDSGLGSETSALHTTATSITDTSQLNMTTVTPAQTPTQTKTKDSEKLLSSNILQLSKSPPKEAAKPFRSNLKRRLEVDDDGLGSLTATASALSDHSSLNGSIQKKPKRSINFDTVQVYYFPRQQGFSCVPSAGGCTLGMGARHVAFKTLTLAEHAAELRRAHRMQLQEINPRGSSSDDSEESEEDYLSEGSGSDLDGESNGFLQPVSPKQRRALLKAAGIRKIDPSEKADCRNIRNSREVCGCTCRDFCDPETCACSQSGIKCQVDRDMFPCGCSRDACGNTIGRVEFNPTRVRTHYIHTLMRLEMENRQQQNPYSSAVASPMQPTPSTYYQSHLQPQSNYSSGYASPAYNTASELHQQTAANTYYHSQTPSTSNGLYGQQPTLEMTHSGSAAVAATTTSQYGIDSLDSSLFGGTASASPSYGELMPVSSSYHYGNVQTQASSYNSYHNTPYINANNSTASLNTPNTYSSCAVPSIPPYGTATTTEATGVYHSVSTLTSLETTTAPSCSVNGTISLENDASSNFISLSTPLASSSRLSQINDLLQHNRNATTALVAVSQNIGATDNDSAASVASSLRQVNGVTDNLPTSSSSACSSINTPPIEDAPKSCLAYEGLVAPLKPAPIVAVIEKDICRGSVKTTSPIVTDIIEDTPTLPLKEEEQSTAASLSQTTPASLNTEILPESSLLCNNEHDNDTLAAVSAKIEPSTIEVAAGN